MPDNFPINTAAKPCKYGHASTRDKRGKCRECVKASELNFRQNHPNYQTTYMRGYRATKPEKAMLFLAAERARRDGIACTITEEDISIPEFCPLLGIKLARGSGRGGVQASSPTLDRLHSTLGYVRGNVWVISHRANSIKSDATLAELEMLTANLAKTIRVLPWDRK